MKIENRISVTLFLALASGSLTLSLSYPSAPAADADPESSSSTHQLDSFKRQMLTDVYYSEGISVGDINSDGKMDIVYGPSWYAGPDFKTGHRIYAARPQPREGYANHFFSWVYDFNGDSRPDVFTVGFPGKPAHVYENPGPDKIGERWTKHEVFDWVSNESPHFTDIVGDKRPELVCTRDGHFGYATIDWKQPFKAWTFHKISEKVAHTRFGHGLGVGDVNGDGRSDVIMQHGWFEQPSGTGGGEAMWKFHKVPFAPRGGAEMYAYDVDGDGDQDVITSLAAHEFGLSWFEQIKEKDKAEPSFKEHLIMGDRPAQNRYGVVFSELHSVNLADVDGDGLKDIVTGKTYWSHHRQSPMWDAGAVVYWFQLVRGKDGVDWIPHKADGESGIGRQVVVADVNGDKLPDILAGGMKGAHVMLHQRTSVDAAAWKAAQPKRVVIEEKKPVRGPLAIIDAKTGLVPGALEAEGEFLKVSVSKGKVGSQDMKAFKGGQWSGNAHAFWTGGGKGDKMELLYPISEDGSYQLETVLSCAPDYAIVQLALDGAKLGEPVDLYEFSKVTTTGVLKFGGLKLKAGPHKLTIEILGANPSARQSRFVGVDYVRMVGK